MKGQITSSSYDLCFRICWSSKVKKNVCSTRFRPISFLAQPHMLIKYTSHHSSHHDISVRLQFCMENMTPHNMLRILNIDSRLHGCYFTAPFAWRQCFLHLGRLTWPFVRWTHTIKLLDMKEHVGKPMPCLASKYLDLVDHQIAHLSFVLCEEIPKAHAVGRAFQGLANLFEGV